MQSNGRKTNAVREVSVAVMKSYEWSAMNKRVFILHMCSKSETKYYIPTKQLAFSKMVGL